MKTIKPMYYGSPGLSTRIRRRLFFNLLSLLFLLFVAVASVVANRS